MDECQNFHPCKLIAKRILMLPLKLSGTCSFEESQIKFVCGLRKYFGFPWVEFKVISYEPEEDQIETTCVFFSQYVQNGPNDELEILFQFLRYWGLQHNWIMRNSFMFKSLYEEIERHSYVEFLNVRKCGDHSLKCIFNFCNGFT